ncbi:hypothetical protein [Marinobacter sp. LV10R510-11A]|uniref:hypothetical protein n=1 Tax=Marinobacter sp. LV10R510-11A TaxID=1415568 RepID=UPI001D0D0370|nr:hypothetical protein [Marinobacter sp. LV10R510-11A]
MFRESFKGQRKITARPTRKRGGDNKSDTHWVSVLVVRDRSADEADFVFKHFTLKKVEQHRIHRRSVALRSVRAYNRTAYNPLIS